MLKPQIEVAKDDKQCRVVETYFKMINTKRWQNKEFDAVRSKVFNFHGI